MDSGTGKSIAITGAIASGKSRVSRYWASFAGLPLIDVDVVCAELLAEGNAGWQAIKKEFGTAFLFPDGRIDRKRLRTVLFSDAQVRHKINDLIHPLAFERTIAAIEMCPEDTVLVDVPLLFEAGWEDYFDYRILVFADPAQCCRRLIQRDSIDPEEAGRTILSQLSLHDKILRSDHVINNSGSWVSTLLETIHLARLIALEKEKV
ncbi:MAG: dephospho-CoA kinase [Desulfobulbaceae bacterium]|nr:dephospho-CoA kinase [Desulfobulbaceae bacterium]